MKILTYIAIIVTSVIIGNVYVPQFAWSVGFLTGYLVVKLDLV